MQVALGSFAQPAATGNQSVTGLTFKPRLVLFFMDGNTADGSIANVKAGWGAATSSTNRAWMGCAATDNNASNMTGIRRFTAAACVGVPLTSSTFVEADFVSMNTDGFTINWTNVDATARVVSWIALGDIEAYVSLEQTPSGTGAKSVVTGFKPDAVMFFPNASVAALPEINQNACQYGIGFCAAKGRDLTTDACAVVAYSPSNTSSGKYQSSAPPSSYTHVTESGTIGSEATLTSFDPTGYTLNFVTNTDASTNFRFLSVAIRGVLLEVGRFNSPTSNSAQQIRGTAGTPKLVLLASVNSASASGASTAARCTIGGAISPNDRFSRHNCGTDTGTTVCSNNLDRTKVMKTLVPGATGGAPTLTSAADVTGLYEGGFDLNWTTTDATAREILYATFSEPDRRVGPAYPFGTPTRRAA